MSKDRKYIIRDLSTAYGEKDKQEFTNLAEMNDVLNDRIREGEKVAVYMQGGKNEQ